MPNLNYNKITLGGRLCDEPELRSTQNGKNVANFRIAVGRRFKQSGENSTDVDFFSCTAWESKAETITRFFHKGSSILLTGAMQNSKYTKKDGSEAYRWDVIVDEITFVDSLSDSSQTRQNAATSQPNSNMSNSQQNVQTSPQAAHGALQTTYIPQSYSNVTSDSFKTVADDKELPF